MKSTLTVFTPTYNRAYTLHQCYESLVRQTCKDFIWLIIDDGSTDNTKELVDSWIAQKKVNIRYHYQANQGMHGAHNTAYEHIDTELNVCIDSDDYMPDDAVEKIISFWKKHGSDNVSGIIGLDCYPDGRIVGTRLPDNVEASTLYDIYYKFGVKGDKKLVYRSDLTRLYPYPVFAGEKYVSLSYKYILLDQQYKMLLMNDSLCCVRYMEDGSSLNMLSQYRKNPRGFAFFRKEAMKQPNAGIKHRLRQAAHYVSSSLIAKNWKFMKETPCKLLTLFAIPLGILLFSYIMLNTGKYACGGK